MSIYPGKLGKYELQTRLGQGGMAEVWKALDQSLQRPVAIKFMHTTLQNDATFTSRFVREAQAVAALHHPNIVQIYDFEISTPGNSDGQAYMVMDYIEGETLADYLATTSYIQKFPTASEIVSLLFSISEAIDYAHQQGLLHRDIKPANILLDKRRTTRNPMGEPILTDFGIAKMLGTNDGTLTSSVFGTPFYMSPEQARGQLATAASDIYALGVILYELYTGERPFKGDTAFAILQQHITASPLPPQRLNAAISPAITKVIERALAKDPAARFSNATNLVEALAEACGIASIGRQRSPLSLSDIKGLPASSNQWPELPTRLLAGMQMTEVKTPPRYPTGPATPTPDLHTPPHGMAPTVLAPERTDQPRQERDFTPALPVTPPPVPVRPATRVQKRRGLVITLVGCLGLALLGSGLGAFLYQRTMTSSTTTAHSAVSGNTLVGKAFFTSSGAASGTDNLGLNDTFQVHLTSVPGPAAGKNYYAWLLPDLAQSEGNPRALGQITLDNGVATLAMPYVDPQHANLLVQFSRFLVTEEDANPAPQSPSLDTKLWRYYAAIPQNPPSGNCQGVTTQLSSLCHLRHLLSGDPELVQVNLQGGLNYWFLNNVKEVQKWAQEAVDHSDPVDVRHKLVDILYMLDGRGCIVQDLQQHADLELDNRSDDTRLSSIAAIPLLDCGLTPNTPGYLTHIHNHLNAMIHAAGVQNDQITIAEQIGTELNTLNKWLSEVQKNARQLVAMDNTQLMETDGQNLRNQIDTMTTNVLSGGTDPDSGAMEKGAQNVSDQIQQLATLDVLNYTTA